MQKFNRQHRSCQIRERNGQISFDGVLKEGEVIKIVNEKQVGSYKKKKQNTANIQEHIQANEGDYVHLIYKYGFPLMDRLQAKCEGNKANVHIIRFVQLATYSTFGGKLFDDNNNRIKKSSLGKIWDTKSRNSINETYDLLMECGYTYEDTEVVDKKQCKYSKKEIQGTKEDKYIMISEDLIVKGAIEDFKKLKKEYADLTYTRVFSKNVQDMYEGAESKARKQLANLFKILPFINFKHNVFCGNPTETDPKQLDLYTWTELARICGYDDKNVAKFKRELMKLRIYTYEVIGQFETGSGKAICINPKVYYSGDNADDVRKLYAMFEMCDGASTRR